jgi:hypothetical protein
VYFTITAPVKYLIYQRYADCGEIRQTLDAKMRQTLDAKMRQLF